MLHSNWDTYSRQGIDLAADLASFGFGIVKSSTMLGFSITRAVASLTLGLTTSAVDHALFGGGPVTTPILSGALSSIISIAEQITLAPIRLGEYITSTSLLAAHSSINLLSCIFPGSSEASFSLASFITLVKREWNELAPGENLPEKKYGVTHVARALVAWVVLQGVTQEWDEARWLKGNWVREVHVEDPRRYTESLRERRGSRVRVTSDVIWPGGRGRIVSADFGDASTAATIRQSLNSTAASRSLRTTTRAGQAEMKVTLRRLSKMVLAGYGGASLLFFGVPINARPSATSSASKRTEEAQMAHAINASEAEAAGDGELEEDMVGAPGAYSWWDVLLGKHDHEIFERFANGSHERGEQSTANAAKDKMKATAVIGIEHQMPRFWVLTDHGRGQIVLVLRGTMSLNEIAVDLTCDPEDFQPARTTREEQEPISGLPGSFPGFFPTPPASPPMDNKSTAAYAFPSFDVPDGSPPTYHVHSGMLRMARAMGEIGKPVHLAVHTALYRNPEYELVLCGHSLGAGVAALLGLMWADPNTCKTVKGSGLPTGRRVGVYCFAPPCLTDPQLSRLASQMVVSFVYSHDVVSRLSIGSVRDIRNASVWMCDAHERTSGEEGWLEVIKRGRGWGEGKERADNPMGRGTDSEWFISVRKTLEANMQMANLCPPGRVFWAMRDSDLHPSHRKESNGSTGGKDKLRLFEVLDVKNVFAQIVFAKDMLSAHMPHQYDRVLHDLL